MEDRIFLKERSAQIEVREGGRQHEFVLESWPCLGKLFLPSSGIYRWSSEAGEKVIDVSSLNLIGISGSLGSEGVIVLEGGRLKAEGGGYVIDEPENSPWLEVNREIIASYKGARVFSLRGMVLRDFFDRRCLSGLLRGWGVVGRTLEGWERQRDVPVLLYSLVWMNYGSHYRRD
jgi:hypothetical protein